MLAALLKDKLEEERRCMCGVTASEDCNKSFATRGFTAVKFPKASGQGSSREMAEVPLLHRSKHPFHTCPASAKPQKYSTAIGLWRAMFS